VQASLPRSIAVARTASLWVLLLIGVAGLAAFVLVSPIILMAVILGPIGGPEPSGATGCSRFLRLSAAKIPSLRSMAKVALT
jgi:hypothetical protein